VESLDRAVTVLGTDGLRSLASTAILQPVFKLPKGFFDRFADIVWEQAQRSAAGAQAYAEATFDKDPFVAQLLGVLRSLATLVLFRVTLDKYRTLPDLEPLPEVFIRVLRSHRARLAIEIARTWQLSDASIEALVEQQREISPTRMTQLGSALYYGELAGSLATLVHHGRHAADAAQDLLLQQGLQAGIAPKVLHAAESADLTA
jgi:HD-like signal output (HDOD) protein